MNINNGGSYNKKIAFSGHKKIVDDCGYEKQKFFLPYDKEKYAASIQLYRVEKNADGKYVVNQDDKSSLVYEKNLDKNTGESELLNINEMFKNKDQFAYRFKLTPIDKKGIKIEGAEPKYAFDAGTVTNMLTDKMTDNKFNIVFNNRATVNKAGKMQLIMPDEYYPGVEKKADGTTTVNGALRANALASVRTHTNKLGGGLLGIMHKLPELEEEGYTRIVGMPITKDTVSSHLYWTQNAFQLSPQLGTIDDFKKMQTDMFKHGINWVSDAALVNEGLQGVHFSNLLKWGKESPFYNWFKVTGLDNGNLTLGVFPEKTENVRYKLVNSPYKLDENFSKNEAYDGKKPTYVQFYDNRLASNKQKNSNALIETYEKNNTDNTYDINSHNDTVYPYSFEINPQILRKNINNLKPSTKGGKIDLQNIETIKKIMKFENFDISKKQDSAGFETWDGNTDIAKLNFYWGKVDEESLKGTEAEKLIQKNEATQGILQVKDYAINSGKYWTKLAADTQLGYVAELLKGTFPDAEDYMAKINEEVTKGNLPKSTLDVITPDVLNNILDGKYKSDRLNSVSDESAEDTVLKEVLDYPLETLPVGDDLLAVLTSPYIAKRATTPEQLGVSRLEIFKAGNENLPEQFKRVQSQADSLYTEELSSFALSILDSLDMDLFEGNETTDLGKYVISQVMPDIMQYATLKGLDPKAKIDFSDDGKIDFNQRLNNEITLGSLNISGGTPEAEAEKLVKHLKVGISEISAEERAKLTAAIKIKLKDADSESFKVADAIIDRTESGMGWRIDAAKDVSSIDAVRHGDDSFSAAWENAIGFWKAFNQTVKQVNPHVYTTAEITDLNDLTNPNNIPNCNNGRFANGTDAETKFLEETGITTTANYSYFFSLIPRMFGSYSETGKDQDEDFGEVGKLKDKLDKGWGSENPGFLYQAPLDGVLHSYTFVGNHDKPRILHTLALNMELFYSDFKNDGHKEDAVDVLGKDSSSRNFDKVSGRAIAMGKKLKEAFSKANLDEASKTAINNAIATLAGGEFNKQKFDPDAFGSRPFEIVISNVLEQAEIDGLKLDKETKAKLEADVLGTVLKPAMDKYLSIYKTLVTLPGDVTDFAGDKLGSTGYESKAKNYTQQNRNTIRWEWLDNPNRQYIKQFNKQMNDILGLRNESLDPKIGNKLSALNDGIPVSLKNDNDKGFASVLRYNDSGSTVLTLYNTLGATKDNDASMRSDETSKMDAVLTNARKKNVNDPEPDEKTQIAFSKIELGKGNNIKEGLSGGLTVGTKFKSTRTGDDSDYVVVFEDDVYYDKDKKNTFQTYSLIRQNAQGQRLPINIKPEDYNALVLYKV